MSTQTPDLSCRHTRFDLGQVIFQYMRIRLHLDQVADPGLRMGTCVPPLVPFETMAEGYLERIRTMGALEYRAAIGAALDYCGREGKFTRTYARYAAEVEAVRRPRVVSSA